MNKKNKIKKQAVRINQSKKNIKIQKESKKRIRDKDMSLEKSFWTVDGKVLRNLKQAIRYLEKVKKSVAEYHINKRGNDFANWIRDVYGKKQVAEKIRKVKTPKQIANIIKKILNKQ